MPLHCSCTLLSSEGLDPASQSQGRAPPPAAGNASGPLQDVYPSCGTEAGGRWGGDGVLPAASAPSEHPLCTGHLLALGLGKQQGRPGTGLLTASSTGDGTARLRLASVSKHRETGARGSSQSGVRGEEDGRRGPLAEGTACAVQTRAGQKQLRRKLRCGCEEAAGSGRGRSRLVPHFPTCTDTCRTRPLPWGTGQGG